MVQPQTYAPLFRFLEGGVMKFTDQSALDNYGAHPVHRKLLNWLIPLIDPIEVDFDDGI